MNEFTTVDNIKKAFSLLLGGFYTLDFDEQKKTFYLINNTTMQSVLNFEYDKESRKFSYYTLTEPEFGYQLQNIFHTFNEFPTCQLISDTFFNHDLAQILFKDPIVFSSNTFQRAKTVGKSIKLSPNFYYQNAWNVIFVELGYVLTEELKIKPIIDLCINLRGFGKTRFLVDEHSGQFVNLLDTTHYRLFTEMPGTSNTTISCTHSADVLVINRAINSKSSLVSIRDYIDDFMIKVSPELYTFYINQFNLSGAISEAKGNLNDFKVLEMLKV